MKNVSAHAVAFSAFGKSRFCENGGGKNRPVFERRPQGGASFGLFPPQFSGKIVGFADSLDLLVLLHQGKRTVTLKCRAASRPPEGFIPEMCIVSVYLSHRYFFGLTSRFA
jgi:hypothetical protein